MDANPDVVAVGIGALIVLVVLGWPYSCAVSSSMPICCDRPAKGD